MKKFFCSLTALVLVGCVTSRSARVTPEGQRPYIVEAVVLPPQVTPPATIILKTVKFLGEPGPLPTLTDVAPYLESFQVLPLRVQEGFVTKRPGDGRWVLIRDRYPHISVLPFLTYYVVADK